MLVKEWVRKRPKLLYAFAYHTRAIITRSLYTFYPIFEGQKTFIQGAFFVKFWPFVRFVLKSGCQFIIKSGLWWRAYGICPYILIGWVILPYTQDFQNQIGESLQLILSLILVHTCETLVLYCQHHDQIFWARLEDSCAKRSSKRSEFDKTRLKYFQSHFPYRINDRYYF